MVPELNDQEGPGKAIASKTKIAARRAGVKFYWALGYVLKDAGANHKRDCLRAVHQCENS
jgi:hypothetical protein